MVSALLRRAAGSCRSGRCGEAIDLLESAVRLEPANFGLHQRLGLCYSGGCRPHPLASADLAVTYLCHALALAGPGCPAGARARILDTLGNTYARMRRFAAAIECHREAAALYRAAGQADDWAREEFNLANVCCELGRWREAIEHYRSALEVRTRERDARRYAATIENLGTAYREVRDHRRAIDCYRRALRVCTAFVHPAQNAALHHNLGNIYLSLPGTRNARRALRHLDRALTVRTRAASPGDYATTQFHRGHAFARLLMQDRAAECFHEAHEGFLASGQRDNAAMARGLCLRAEAAARPLDGAPAIC